MLTSLRLITYHNLLLVDKISIQGLSWRQLDSSLSDDKRERSRIKNEGEVKGQNGPMSYSAILNTLFVIPKSKRFFQYLDERINRLRIKA